MVRIARDVEVADRRRHSRRPLVTACKVRDSAGFTAGYTADLSAGGCRFTTDRDRVFAQGQEVRVGIALHDGAVLEERAMLPGRVRRVRTLEGGEQEVAVEFDWVRAQESAYRSAA